MLSAQRSQSLRNTITIDRGKKDGVLPTMPVVTADGLAGKGDHDERRLCRGATVVAQRCARQRPGRTQPGERHHPLDRGGSEPSIKLVGDLVEYCNREIPRFNAISVSGTHIMEYGANTMQSVALAITIAEVYIREVLKRGSRIDEIAPLFSFHLPIGGRNFNFFEDICRLRAARRYWAKLMKEKYGAQDKRSLQFRFSTGGMGGGSRAEQPLNNIARATIYAMAAVFSGTRSLNLACYDEVYAIPSDLAIRTSLRVQQILAYETGVADVVDPLGGSYYVEALTDEMEAKIGETIGKIESDGGIVKLIESGAIQRELARQSYALQTRISSGEKVLVGVNKFKVKEEERDLEIYKTDPETINRQLQRLKAVKASRDRLKVEGALQAAGVGGGPRREHHSLSVRAAQGEGDGWGDHRHPEEGVRDVQGTDDHIAITGRFSWRRKRRFAY